MEGRHTPSSPRFALLQSPIDARNGTIPEWFHGIITRKAAEALLLSKPLGCFLVRVSETRIGFTLSYRTEGRCRHFMIDALGDGSYNIVGETRHHRSLQDLVDFHGRTPIRNFHELLTVPCGQDETNSVELLSTSSKTHEDVQPPLPRGPAALTDSEVPNGRPHRLYPHLADGGTSSSSQTPALLQANAVTLTLSPRKTHAADNTRTNYKPPPEKIPDGTKNHGDSTRGVSAYENPAVLGIVFTQITLKKKFQNRGSASQVRTHPEIRGESEEKGEDYQLPPPFAPGF